MSTSIIIKVCI